MSVRTDLFKTLFDHCSNGVIDVDLHTLDATTSCYLAIASVSCLLHILTTVRSDSAMPYRIEFLAVSDALAGERCKLGRFDVLTPRMLSRGGLLFRRLE